MSTFHSVAKLGEIPPGEGRAFPVEGHMVAVFNVDGEHYAISDFCPHQGAPLSGGYLDGDEVTCPWHAWRFCVKDGVWSDSPTAKLKAASYPVRIVGEDIQVSVDLPEADASESNTPTAGA